MRLIIDGDGCPDKNFIFDLAQKCDIEMYVFIDYAHVLQDCDYHVIRCEVGHDSVDMAIVNFAKKGDLVITQDYGLAGLLLTKNVQILHTNGKVIDEDNINLLLSTRYIHAQLRRAGQKTKGPSKRTKEDTRYLLKQLENILKQQS